MLYNFPKEKCADIVEKRQPDEHRTGNELSATILSKQRQYKLNLCDEASQTKEKLRKCEKSDDGTVANLRIKDSSREESSNEEVELGKGFPFDGEEEFACVFRQEAHILISVVYFPIL